MDEYYRHFGIEGFDYPNEIPGAECILRGENIGYHKRFGLRCLSRYDRQGFMEFASKRFA
ncbi:hypothetical protein [Qingrenia yutianensis]|uniref:Uncharacterized protein n=1 Tax=Qingrenia yutianensis TaxID=2763676 RepID=A0A926F966_9FIRM|nr:hypothetical protein [Qingrenia yutianensis]MBC8596255.1 hypothetical protein [Qingrenia yutianensis]